jgi:hypothetical protein
MYNESYRQAKATSKRVPLIDIIIIPLQRLKSSKIYSESSSSNTSLIVS